MDLPAKQQAPVYLWVYSGVVSPHSPSVCVGTSQLSPKTSPSPQKANFPIRTRK